MPAIYEVFYAGEGGESEFYATRAEAERQRVLSQGEAMVNRYEYEPTKKGVTKLLNHIAGPSWINRGNG